MDPDVGGQVQGISLESFLQMVQMEKSTCTLKVIAEGEIGFIYILKGEMIAAATGVIEGLDAALEIISWQNSVIEIENTCEKTEDTINQPLMAILEEGLQRRGQQPVAAPEAAAPEPPVQESDGAPEPPAPEGVTDEEAAPTPKKTAARKKPAKPAKKTKKKGKKARKQPSVVMIAGFLIALAGAGYFFYMQSGSGDAHRYEAMQERLGQIAEPEIKQDLIETFLATQPEEEYAAAARTQLAAVIDELAFSAFKIVDSRAQDLVGAGKFEAAITAYRNFIQQYPQSTITRNAKKAIGAVQNRMADETFEGLKNAVADRDPGRLGDLVAFREAYPSSAHVDTIEAAIEEMAEAYYNYIKGQLGIMVKQEQWAECQRHAQRFVSLYPDHPHASEFKQLASHFKRRQQEKAAYEELMQGIVALGSDIDAAKKRLETYLEKYPDVYTRAQIEDRIREYDQHITRKRLMAAQQAAEASLREKADRFTIKPEGVFVDKKTGKTWTLLDSQTVLQKCLDHQSAKTYAGELTTGGYTDWRLPRPKELAALHDGHSAYTAGKSDWYWTSEAVRRYSGQWYIHVTVLDRHRPQQPVLAQKEARECGSVLAVRP